MNKKHQYRSKYRNAYYRLTFLTNYLLLHYKDRDGLYSCESILDVLGIPQKDGYVKYTDMSLFLDDVDIADTWDIMENKDESDVGFKCARCGYEAKDVDMSSWFCCPSCGSVIF